ncbi:DEDD exonuclease domain-containing protein [Georgenia sp. Z1491]|uniref:DEDD exonuclease domain-containing protein n=1 Tax=Georgenia sp. Z1491 TaxID=3416707 RepID=UPI003CEAEDD0
MSSLLAPPPGRRLVDDGDARGGSDAQGHGRPYQVGLDELGTPLSEVTFVVVDLETTGGAARSDRITEIGAVKVRGGEVLAELGTLVNPGIPVPPQITVLTGITTAMVAPAPPIEEVLPTFLEMAGFDRGSVLVAHNARFDVGFLKEAMRRHGREWPAPMVVDTVQLARRVVTNDEVPNRRLGTLAAYFGATTTPDHRALSDARATVDVLHALIGRLTPLGITHREDLPTLAEKVPAHRRRKASIADGLSRGPGVYRFVGPGGQVLYVGRATNLRQRVRSYFTSAERRARIGEMVDLAASVEEIPCATVLEARVRELRLIAELDPPYNRRSKRPSRLPWVRLTDEPHPRLTIVRSLDAARLGTALGPFGSQRAARLAVEALQSVVPVRRCTARLPAVPRADARACALAELGQCSAPCAAGPALLQIRPRTLATGTEEPVDHDQAVAGLRRALAGDLTAVRTALLSRIGDLAARQRYEEAATERDRLRALLVAARRTELLRPLVATAEIVAARARPAGGWEIVVVRHGRLAGTAISAPGVDPMATVADLVATAEHVPVPTSTWGAASAEETEILAEWLWRGGTRIVDRTGDVPLGSPVGGAGSLPLPPGPDSLIGDDGGRRR